MVCLKICRRLLLIAMLLTSLAVFPGTDCRLWELQTDSQNFTVENGVESNIDFFLADYRSLDERIRLIVQHRSSGEGFTTKCQLELSATGGCQQASGPCQCVGNSSGSYRYRLRMNFSEQDGGQWMFQIVNHGKTFVNITVISHRPLKIYTNSQSVIVENGVESSIDFFLNDSTAVDIGAVMVVQHQKDDKGFDQICRIHHTKTGGCLISFGPCECIGERSGTYQYRLRKLFTEQDGGLWKFDIVSHEGTIVNVTVIPPNTSLQGQQSTEQVTIFSPPIKSYTLSATTVVIVIFTAIIIIITSLVAVLWCRLRSQRALVGETESPLEEPHLHEDPGQVEQGQCEVQSSKTATLRDMQSADHLDQATEAGDTHPSQRKHFSGFVRKELPFDYRKTSDTDADSITSTSTTPPAPELPPRLYI